MTQLVGAGWTAARIVTLLTICLWFAFAIGFLGRRFWIADLFAHFRIQYAALLSLCAIALAWMRHPAAAALAVCGAMLATVSIVHYIGWHPQHAQAATHDFRLVTFNRQFGNEAFSLIGNYLQDIEADVIAIQEVDSSRVLRQLVAALPGHPHVYAELGPLQDTVIFSRWPIVSGETIELLPRGARVSRTAIAWRGRTVTIVGVHLHWPMGADNTALRDSELRELARLARTIEGPLLIGGDLNVTPWSPTFGAMLRTSGLQDCARGKSVAATWPAGWSPVGIRIDHCLASDHWRALDVRRGAALGSDHYAVISDLALAR
jgi:endonuclease/exonuclease/phosphatase (EEP) superfamily protein YafD